MDDVSLHSLQEIVQRNCHISDARHATDYTLCVYLLKMREYYRWEKGFSQSDGLSSDEVGEWLTQREALWDELETQEYLMLELGGQAFDPFDVEGINSVLSEHGLVYSAGYGKRGAAHFFLADLESATNHGSSQLLISAREHARDLTSPPAMSLGQTIFVRRESFRRMLWEKIQESEWARCETPMKRALAYYDFTNNPSAALDLMTDRQIKLLQSHEMGEQAVERLFGASWADMLLDALKGRLEFQLRGIRDFLADCLVTLPELLEAGEPEHLHFYFSTLTPRQKELFPTLLKAYERWLVRDDSAPLYGAVARGKTHWEELAVELMKIHQQRGDEWETAAQVLINDSVL